jgi:hypothetical protein
VLVWVVGMMETVSTSLPVRVVDSSTALRRQGWHRMPVPAGLLRPSSALDRRERARRRSWPSLAGDAE